MANDLPCDYDVIIIGTGLTESIVASAVARAGKQVLHLDSRDYYGSSWASMSMNALRQFLVEKKKLTETKKCESSTLEASPVGAATLLDYHRDRFTNVSEQWYLPEQARSEEIREGFQTRADLIKESRRFNLDLSPKILYSRGEMVDLLIASGICRYAEFRNVANVYTVEGKLLVPVPCSRADVFASTHLTMVEKRLLMRTLTFCAEPETSLAPNAGMTTFGEMLTKNKIEGRVRGYMVNAVAMAAESDDLEHAAAKVRKFVRSIGRYGNTPFLWTMYGSGELPQCFCRLCAVFGGIYCLNRTVDHIAVDAGKAVGVVSEGQLLKAEFLVIEDSLNPNAVVCRGVSRAVLVTDRSLVADDQVTLVNFPPNATIGAVHVLQLPAAAMACPRNLFVVHLVTPQVDSAEKDLRHVVSTLFDISELPDPVAADGHDDIERHPRVLWALYFNANVYDEKVHFTGENIFSARGPDALLDVDVYVAQAKSIYSTMFPGEEFLARVPDPEDVILGDPDEEEERGQQQQLDQ